MIATIFLCSCELISIGSSKRQKQIEATQKTAVGAVWLFKAELDSNNINGAMKVLASPQGRLMLAIEKYEMYEEISRFRNIMGNHSFSSFKTDTITDDWLSIKVEADNQKHFKFLTFKVNNLWYVTEFGSK